MRWALRNWRDCSRRLCSAWQPRGEVALGRMKGDSLDFELSN